MRTGRPKAPVVLSETERSELEQLAHSRVTPHAIVQRAKIALLAADGLSNVAIASALGITTQCVSKWRNRISANGIGILDDNPRSGRPRSHSDEDLASLLQRSLEAPPPDVTQWSSRRLEAETGVSRSTIQRLWQVAGVKPHQRQSFRLSSDPYFTEKVRDIVGLYLDPPYNAIVLCVDEKSQCQALERAQPNLPIGLGYVEGYTSDYKRHGTTTLFAALDIASGNVLTQCRQRHRHQEFLSFLRHIDEQTPADLDLHLVLDNYGSHKHSKVRLWLAQHPRVHVHFTPTHASWMNQVEIWFGLITRQTIRRGSFRSVQELKDKIELFVAQYNRTATPFAWVATADSIFEKLRRLTKRICEP